MLFRSSFNELKYARQVARLLGTDHEEHIVDYDVRELVPKLVGHFGEPFADSSAIPTYHLSKVTRSRVTWHSAATGETRCSEDTGAIKPGFWRIISIVCPRVWDEG